MEKKFYVNSDERIARVTLTVDEGEFTGTATCSSEDNFDLERGLALAEKRALVQVKEADIDIFKNELAEVEERIKGLADDLRKYRKVARSLKAAKECRRQLYAEIKELSI